MRGIAAILGAFMLALPGCGEAPDGRLTGYVEAELVYVAPESGGRLVVPPPEAGTEVAAGQVLFALDDALEAAALRQARERLAQAEAEYADLTKGARPTELAEREARVREARADVDYARKERKRIEALVARGALPPARADEARARHLAAQARLASAQAALKTARLAAREDRIAAARAGVEAARAAVHQAEIALARRTVSAPVGGRIEERLHEAGEIVTAGAPTVVLLPRNALKVRFFVPQALLGTLAAGQRVTVHTDAGASVPATISFIARDPEYTPPVIYSEKSRAALVFLVEARPQDAAGLRPGQPVDVRLPPELVPRELLPRELVP